MLKKYAQLHGSPLNIAPFLTPVPLFVVSFIAFPLDLLVQEVFLEVIGIVGSDLVPLLDEAERVRGET